MHPVVFCLWALCQCCAVWPDTHLILNLMSSVTICFIGKCIKHQEWINSIEMNGVGGFLARLLLSTSPSPPLWWWTLSPDSVLPLDQSLKTVNGVEPILCSTALLTNESYVGLPRLTHYRNYNVQFKTYIAKREKQTQVSSASRDSEPPPSPSAQS